MDENPIVTPLEELQSQLTNLIQRLAAQLDALAQAESDRAQALDTREADLDRRENAAKARQALEARGLPASLADCLTVTDENGAEAAAEALEKAFRAAVQQAVEARLCAEAPRSASPVPLSEMCDEDYYAAVCRND